MRRTPAKLALINTEAIFDLIRCQARKGLRQNFRIKGITVYIEHASADSGAGMEVNQLRHFPEMSADPMSDVVDRQCPDAAHTADFFINHPMQRAEVLCLCKFPSDPLKLCLHLL